MQGSYEIFYKFKIYILIIYGGICPKQYVQQT